MSKIIECINNPERPSIKLGQQSQVLPTSVARLRVQYLGEGRSIAAHWDCRGIRVGNCPAIAPILAPQLVALAY